MTHLMTQASAALRGRVAAIAMIGVTLITCLPNGALAQPELKKPSPNAALHYQQAAESIDQLPEDDRALVQSVVQLKFFPQYSPGRQRELAAAAEWGPEPSSWPKQDLVRFSENVPTDEKAKETVARFRGALHLFRQGTDSPMCDWGWVYKGEVDTSVDPRSLILTELVGSAVFRARYHWALGRQREAIEDLQALKRFAVHVGAGGQTGLVNVVMQFNIERVAVFTIAEWLVDAETAEVLKKVTEEPNRRKGNLAKNALLVETGTFLPWAQQLIDRSDLTAEQRLQQDKKFLTPGGIRVGDLFDRFTEDRLLRQIGQSHKHYREAGELLDLPPGEFPRQFDNYVDHIYRTRNVFSILSIARCPGIVRAYHDVKELSVRWAMLKAAVDIHRLGPNALSQHTDPIDDGPFEYRSSDDGFVFGSRLIVNGDPVTMRFHVAAQGNN